MSRKPKRIFLARDKKGRLFCCAGPPDNCHNLKLLQAEVTEFHDAPLVEATEQINEILARLRERSPEDLHLALINTSLGLLLVWAEAIDRPDDLSGYVTAESDEEEIEEALGLYDDRAAA